MAHHAERPGPRGPGRCRSRASSPWDPAADQEAVLRPNRRLPERRCITCSVMGSTVVARASIMAHTVSIPGAPERVFPAHGTPEHRRNVFAFRYGQGDEGIDCHDPVGPRPPDAGEGLVVAEVCIVAPGAEDEVQGDLVVRMSVAHGVVRGHGRAAVRLVHVARDPGVVTVAVRAVVRLDRVVPRVQRWLSTSQQGHGDTLRRRRAVSGQARTGDGAADSPST